jgi:hypothetical protein
MMTEKQCAALLQDLARRLAREVDALGRVLDEHAPGLERATWTTWRYTAGEEGPVALCRNDPSAWIVEEHVGDYPCLDGLRDLLEELEAQGALLLGRDPEQEL